MAQHSILFKKDGITVIFAEGVSNGKSKTLDLGVNDIQLITIEPCQEMKLFSKIPSERIKIKTSKAVHPIIYYRHQEKEFFCEYKMGLRKFARDNKVRIDDLVDN